MLSAPEAESLAKHVPSAERERHRTRELQSPGGALLLAGLVGLAFWLATHDLAAQSLWPDEGYSWDVASRSLAAIGRNVLTDQIHVPGYYFLLHYWLLAAGDSVYSLRLLSVFGGALTVATLASLVRRLAGSPAALLAGSLAAVHPFLLYYSQEARMYSLFLAAVLIELRLLVMCLDRPALWRWAAYAGAVAAGLYLHYTAVVVLPVAALLPLLLGLRRRRLLIENLAALAAGCMAFAPWALFGLGQFNSFAPVTAANAKAGRMLSDFALAINTGEVTFEVRQLMAASVPPWMFVAFVGALALLGAVHAGKRAYSRTLWTSLFVIPAVAVIGIALAGRDFSPRYAIAALLGYIPLVALGLVALPKETWRVVCAGIVLGGFLWWDRLYFTDPAFQRQDFRGAVQYAVDHAAVGDAIILLNAAPLRPIWRYYAPPQLAPRSLPAPLPAGDAAFDQAMRTAAAGSDRAELYLWDDFGEDPEHRVRAWLEANAHPVAGWGSGEIAVYGYFTGDPFPSAPPAGITPVNASFSNQIELLGYRELSGAGRRGLRLQLAWQRLQPLDHDYHVYVHVVDAQGGNLAIADHRPAFDTLNLSQWRGSPYLVDEYELSGDWTRGTRLEIGLYDPVSRERLSPAGLPLPLPST